MTLPCSSKKIKRYKEGHVSSFVQLLEIEGSFFSGSGGSYYFGANRCLNIFYRIIEDHKEIFIHNVDFFYLLWGVMKNSLLLEPRMQLLKWIDIKISVTN